MTTSFTALFDANVLYPAPLRDLLVQLATTGLFRAKWSEDIHKEWISNLLKNRPDLKRKDLDNTRIAMDNALLDCLVENYRELIPSLNLPDLRDRHVLAAAIRGQADVIVTFNIKDFPENELSKYSIQTQHPDDFVSNLLSLAQAEVIKSVRKIRARLKNPPVTSESYLICLERNCMTITASKLREYAESL